MEATDLDAQLGSNDVVVYATGAEAVLDRVAPGTLAIEYRHSPDLEEVDRIVRPLLDGREPVPDRPEDTP